MSDAYFVALAQAAVVHEVPSEWKYSFLVANSNNPMLQSALIVDLLTKPMSYTDYLMLFDQTASTSGDSLVISTFTQLVDKVKNPSSQDSKILAHARKLLKGTRFEKYFAESNIAPESSEEKSGSQQPAKSQDTQDFTQMTVNQRSLRKLTSLIKIERHTNNITKFVNGSS